MFAVLAALAFLVALIVGTPHWHSTTTWELVGLILVALHLAFDVGLAALRTRRAPRS